MGGPDRGSPGGHLSLLRSLRFVFNAKVAIGAKVAKTFLLQRLRRLRLLRPLRLYI